MAKTHIPKSANQEKNCTQLNCRIVSGIFLKSSKILYESKEGETNPYFDFKAASTQQLIVQISIPAMEKSVQKTNLVPNGCVAILVGFKD